MKTLTCKIVSGIDCPYVAKGETDEEVMVQLKEHGQEAHPEEIKKMMEGMSEDDLVKRMKENIQES